MEKGLTRNDIINELSKSSHGKLETYRPTVQRAAQSDPEFLAHLIAWNHVKGQIRDSKVALPTISIATPEFPDEFVGNSLAHFALLDVKMKEQGITFLRSAKIPARRDRAVKRALAAYLKKLESNFPRWERIAVQHRRRLKALYVAAHVKPGETQNNILFKNQYPRGSMFDVIARLSGMSPAEAAGTILERRIPNLIAVGALGANGGALLKDSTVMMALTQQMSSTEVVTRAASLAKKGAKADPVMRAAFNDALAKASGSTKNVLKTTRAAETLEEAGELELAAKLRVAQEKQIAKMAGIEGNWLVLGDKSGSMHTCIEGARQVAATLAKFVKGKVHLVFFNTQPHYVDATGKTYEEILSLTRYVKADGGTSIGCGLLYAIERKLEVDGVAIVSDAQENQAPRYPDVLKAFVQSTGREIPTYLYMMAPHTRGDLRDAMAAAGKDLQEFDLTHGKVDYYSLPNIVQTMRANRYSLIDEIMGVPLLTLEDVLGVAA